MWHELSFYFQLSLSSAKRFVISVGILLISLLSENTGEKRSLKLIFLSLCIFLQSFMETILQKGTLKIRNLKEDAFFFSFFQIRHLYKNALWVKQLFKEIKLPILPYSLQPDGHHVNKIKIVQRVHLPVSELKICPRLSLPCQEVSKYWPGSGWSWQGSELCAARAPGGLSHLVPVLWWQSLTQNCSQLPTQSGRAPGDQAQCPLTIRYWMLWKVSIGAKPAQVQETGDSRKLTSLRTWLWKIWDW